MKNIDETLFKIIGAGVVVILAADEIRQIIWYVVLLAVFAVIYRVLLGGR